MFMNIYFHEYFLIALEYWKKSKYRKTVRQKLVIFFNLTEIIPWPLIVVRWFVNPVHLNLWLVANHVTERDGQWREMVHEMLAATLVIMHEHYSSE